MYDFQLSAVWPEVAMLALTLVVMFADMALPVEKRAKLFGLSAIGLSVIALALFFIPVPEGPIFHGAWVNDGFSFIVKIFAVLVTLSIVLVSRPFLTKMNPHVGEHLLLVLLTGLGLMAVASANSLIVLFVALEIATIPLMILTTLWRRDAHGAEASIKFLIIGSVASAFMVFGMALMWGFSGGAMQMEALGEFVRSGVVSPGFTLGAIMLFIGFGFKAGLVPFHVWVPDVYQGAPTPITAFLAGGSKAAGFAALVRVGVEVFAPGQAFDWVLVLGVIACLTALCGNMAALWQTDLKRLLAHASIGHAGFLLLGLLVVGTQAQTLGLSALAYYLAFYAVAVASVFYVMGLGARGGLGDSLDDYAGLWQRSPKAAAAMLIGVLSMGGIPPLAGFVGKILLMKAVVDAQMIVVAVVMGFAMILSIAYTLKILKVIMVDKASEKIEGCTVCVGPWEGIALLGLTLLLIGFGMFPGPIMESLSTAVAGLLETAPEMTVVTMVGN